MAYLTQTTLATDETAEIVAALRDRFPGCAVPAPTTSATPPRTARTRCGRMADRCDLMLVVGSANSSNTARLVEVARREGCRAELIEDAAQIRLELARRRGRPSASPPARLPPKSLVQRVVDSLSAPRSGGRHRASDHRRNVPISLYHRQVR